MFTSYLFPSYYISFVSTILTVTLYLEWFSSLVLGDQMLGRNRQITANFIHLCHSYQYFITQYHSVSSYQATSVTSLACTAGVRLYSERKHIRYMTPYRRKRTYNDEISPVTKDVLPTLSVPRRYWGISSWPSKTIERSTGTSTW